MRAILRCFGLCGVLWLAGRGVGAQVVPETSVADALRSLSARAGSVFAGQVVSVRPVGGVVEVQFRVDQTLKGQASGGVVLREWAGLWAAGERRYWVGERAVVFLHDAGKGGLSSAVDGMEGVLPLSQVDATVAPAVDVRRLRTVVLRAAGEAMVDSAETMSLTDVSTVVQGGAVTPPYAPGPLPVHGTPVQALPGPAIEGVRKPTRLRPIGTIARPVDGNL